MKINKDLEQKIKETIPIQAPELKERNKKLIGSILSHLGKAKQKIESDSKIKLQEEITHKIAESTKKEAEELKTKQTENIQNRKNELLQNQSEIEKKIKEVEKEIYVNLYLNYIIVN